MSSNSSTRSVSFGGLLLIVMLAVFVSSCGRVIPALGPSNEIFIVCDGGEASGGGRLLRAVLERELFTVEMEKAFTISIGDETDFRMVREHKVVFLVGTWDGGAVKDFIDRYLRGDVSRTSTEVQVFKDVWAKWQTVLVIMARDAEELRRIITEDADSIFEASSAAIRDRLRRSMFADGENMQVEQELRETNGWSIRIPMPYKVRQAGNFVWLEKDEPPRLLFVFWKDAEESELTSSYVIELRDWAGEKFYDGDRVEWQREIGIEEDVEFAGFNALKITGTWGNKKYVTGGPFRTFAFYSQEQERLYLVDIAAYAPGRPKLPLLRELLAVAETFTIAPTTSAQ